eukprot:GHVT01082644.1.p2 GENE.GHVT01082644.1~~GHVT01082644.1.p2  ORF type:complete len:197 (+),score=32.62 GHVT01082644.1:1791-2381(+)
MARSHGVSAPVAEARGVGGNDTSLQTLLSLRRIEQHREKLLRRRAPCKEPLKGPKGDEERSKRSKKREAKWRQEEFLSEFQPSRPLKMRLKPRPKIDDPETLFYALKKTQRLFDAESPADSILPDDEQVHIARRLNVAAVPRGLFTRRRRQGTDKKKSCTTQSGKKAMGPPDSQVARASSHIRDVTKRVMEELGTI